MSCKGECRVEGWHYEMDVTHPRMYARCTECGDILCHVLPKRLTFSSVELGDWSYEQIHERVLRDQPLRQMIWTASREPLRIQPTIISEMEKRLETELERGIADIHERIADDVQERITRIGADMESERDLLYEIYREMLALRFKLENIITSAETSIYRALQQGRFQYPSPDMPPSPLPVICDDRHIQPTIYGLVDPDDIENVRYVGQTVNAGSRFSAHATDKAAPKVREWVRSLKSPPLMVLIENPHRLELDDREAYWIRYYRQRGMADLNTSVRATA